MARIFILVAALAMAGCGESGPMAQIVAADFDKDCRQPSPTPELARDLDSICDCSTARIASSDIALGDSDDAIQAKVSEAMETCSNEYYRQKESGGNSG